MIEAFAAAAGLALCLITLPGTVELLILTIAGSLPARRERNPAIRSISRIAVVVPAHNEEAGVADTVASLKRCPGAHSRHRIVVVADNCDDHTAQRAQAAGARVIVREERTRRGKGYALEYAFEILLAEDFDALAVVDADSEVAPNFLAEIERVLASGADAVQCRYGVLNPNASMRTRLMNVALLAFNVLRPRGRERLGLSVGILGNGFALTRDTLAAVPYDAHSVVEDLEYHLRLVRAGRAVRFADRTVVRGEMPASGAAASTQRSRWEGGRMRIIREQVGPLIADLGAGRWRMLEPLAELLLAPLAFHAALLMLALATPSAPIRWYASAALGILDFHVSAAIAVGGGTLADLGALALAPFYIVWKLALAPTIGRAARKETEWIRTARGNPPGEIRRGEIP
jgi:cellulose synthase/poly-beta-1,6-N-acetylglucosamine synthase-like glycosyltransferase